MGTRITPNTNNSHTVSVTQFIKNDPKKDVKMCPECDVRKNKLCF